MRVFKFMAEAIAIDTDLSVTIFFFGEPSKKFTARQFQDIADTWRHCNRIHKPWTINCWTDVKNGKASNWSDNECGIS